MFSQDLFLEKTWDDLLSRDRAKVIKRFSSLDAESQKVVVKHLTNMATESGWHAEQVISAKTALQFLENQG